MTDLGFIAFPAIVVICYLIGATLKAVNSETLDKFIPVICGFFGGALGVVVFLTIPGYIPAENWLMALAIGIVSGFAATGINQVYKQLSEAVEPGVLVPINDEKTDSDANDIDGDDVDDFEETLEEEET